MSMDFTDGKELDRLCREHGMAISAVMLARETELGERGEREIREKLARSLAIMEKSVRESLRKPKKSLSGLIGGEARKVWLEGLTDEADGPGPSFPGAKSPEEGSGIASLCGPVMTRAIAYSMAVSEENAAMGLIVAAPTAGSAGVLPGALLALAEFRGWSEEKKTDALLNAAAIGYLLMRNASVSGAEAGCQAEVGAAAAMTASAVTELMGGTPEMCFQAASLALSNLLGLVCDPIAGLVEVPCQSRNAIGVANALVCAQLALSGVTHPVPFDEMAEAMCRVGRSLPYELRESAKGGCADTPAGRRCAARCAGRKETAL